MEVGVRRAQAHSEVLLGDGPREMIIYCTYSCHMSKVTDASRTSILKHKTAPGCLNTSTALVLPLNVDFSRTGGRPMRRKAVSEKAC